MKRSRKAALILMVPATSLLLASCGEEPQEALVFTNPTECSQSLLVNADACASEYESAKALHPQVAPKYASAAECEADFGAEQCEQAPYRTSSGGSVFMPMMMGYMMGRMLSPGGAMGGGMGSGTAATGGQAAPNTGAAQARSNLATQPLYKSRDDRTNFRTASNTPVASAPGATRVKPSQVRPQAGQLVRRGGFGQQAAARSPSNSFGG